MYLIYIDESGNTGARKDPDQPIHLIGALMVECEKVRTLEDGIARIVEKYFTDVAFEDGFELHAADIFNGSGLFRRVAPATRIAAVEELIEMLASNEISIGWAAIDKVKLRRPDHPHRLAFVLLVERLEDFLKEKERLGLIVADENKEMEQRLIDDLNIYKRHRTNFGYRAVAVRTIIDSVHFVQSRNNLLIQCTDVIAYFILKGYRTNEGLMARFLATRTARAFDNWAEKNASRKELTLFKLFRKIQKQTVFAKIFPEN